MSKEKTPHVHAAVIHAWADGAVIEFWNIHERKWIALENPCWEKSERYRIKPSAPETRMTADDFCEFGGVSFSACKTIANAAIARALADGDVVLP